MLLNNRDVYIALVGSRFTRWEAISEEKARRNSEVEHAILCLTKA